MNKKVFHLAIPTHSLAEAEEFYGTKLGQEVCRKYDDRITINFFGDQIVCHLAPDKIDQKPQMYPRHFGATFTEKSDFDELYKKCKETGAPFFKDKFSRFKGKKEEHETFFLQDPSNNLLEFKYYFDSTMIY